MTCCEANLQMNLYREFWSPAGLSLDFQTLINEETSIEDSLPDSIDFFSRNVEPRIEMVEGMIREAQIVAFAGPFGVGKSPFLADLTIHLLNGIPWCGREVKKRPVIVFDFESAGPVYKMNIQNISRRFKVPAPKVPDELDVYLEHDDAKEPATAKLLEVLESNVPYDRFKILEEALEIKPNALVILDPVEMLFRINTIKKDEILSLYRKLRLLLSTYPKAAILLTFNLRKKDRRATAQPDLLKSPGDWLEEVSGTLDILNRSDVRIGMDTYKEDIKVINGVRRGEEMHPLLIRSVGNETEGLAGFELCPSNDFNLKGALTPQQRNHWENLPKEFHFDEVADKKVPRASLYRLLNRVKSLGILTLDNGLYRKAS